MECLTMLANPKNGAGQFQKLIRIQIAKVKRRR
jgi:hypothetical protein